MKPTWNDYDLDGELVFTNFLGSGLYLDTLQELLVSVAPRWSTKLRVWRSARQQIPIDLEDPHALSRTVLEVARDHGATYRRLVELHGDPPNDRFRGSVEFRGAGPELVVVLSLDQYLVSALGDRKELGNGIALQVGKPRVENLPGGAWLRKAMRVLCAELEPAWASARQSAEYWSKVMSDGPTIRAVGRDFGSHLPGVFWLNYFGRPYMNLLGRDRLTSVPGECVVECNDGVLVTLAKDPQDWGAPGYAALEEQVRQHLGRDLFFSKDDPDRPGVVPDWEEY